MIKTGTLLALVAVPATLLFAGQSPAAEIPGDLMAAVTKARYAVRFETEEKIPAVSNYAQNLRARFGDEGIEVALRGDHDSQALGIRLKKWGRDGVSRDPGRVAPNASENRVEYRYAGITEWWVNEPRGLEQGFTIAEPPPGDRRQPLVLDLEVTRGWHTALAGDAVVLRGPQGEQLSYSGLSVVGANGVVVNARLSVDDGAIRITVDDRGAVYPITVDPLLANFEAQLLPMTPNGLAGDLFGMDVALDGETALVGSNSDDYFGLANAGSAYVFVRRGPLWSLQAQLRAGDGASDDNFGQSVALDGETALIGAYANDTGQGVNAGSAYVFVRNGSNWNQQGQLEALFDGAADDNFGISVALSGETAVVGASRDDSLAGADAGSAYVFVRSGTTWTQQMKLLLLPAAGAGAGDNFGVSVGIDGQTAVIGAPGDDSAGTDAGAAFVFVRSGTTWSQQRELLATGGAAGDRFGHSIAVEGETALVGAYLNDTGAAADSGAVYVFVRAGTVWTQQQELLSGDVEAGDNLGISVALDGGTALVGAYSDNTAGGTDAGSVYVFVKSGTSWSQQAQLLPIDGAPADRFGASVALSGETALIGAHLDNTPGGIDTGSAWAFVRTGETWNQPAQILPTDGGVADVFGHAVAISGDTALVSATRADSAVAFNTGAAYVFVRSGTRWIQQAQLLAVDGISGDRFGDSVALSGDTALVGADGADNPLASGAGAAYVFLRMGSTWSLQQRLFAADSASNDGFGTAVALEGDFAMVGAIGDDTGGLSAHGSAYVFVRSQGVWTQQDKLLASDGTADDQFGGSVALSGDTALVGADIDDTFFGGTDAGSVYVFIRNGADWIEQTRLQGIGGAANDHFGEAVALSGDTALVGSYQDDTPAGSNAGSAYVFVRSGANWTQQAHLMGVGLGSGDLFGDSVALSGNIALVGASEANNGTGRVFAFERSGASWGPPAPIVAIDGTFSDRFGASVALDGNTALVGAPSHDTAVQDEGAAYVFRLNLLPEMTAATISRTAGSPGASSPIAVVSDTEDAPEALTVTATSVPAGITISNITNTTGTIYATVAASCGATVGPNSVTLQVRDTGGATVSDDLIVNVSPNGAPTLGDYPNTSVTTGGSTSVTPSAGPADNGSLIVTASASFSFIGTVSADSATGVVSIGNANEGTHTITVTATDNCSATATRTFTLTVNPGGLRGDANSDGVHDVLDIFYLINAIFSSGPPPATLCAGDANADTATNAADVIYLIRYLFGAGPAPLPCP